MDDFKLKNKKKRKKLFSIIIVLGLLLPVVTFGYLFYKIKKIDNNKYATNQAEKNLLLKRISEIYFNPNEEVPTIAQISNLELLKDQQFFTEAKEGDIIFVYNQTNRVILYRPSIKKIIEISILEKITDQETD